MVAECSAERVHVSSAPTLKYSHAARRDVGATVADISLDDGVERTDMFER
jgi:hypothetical protein